MPQRKLNGRLDLSSEQSEVLKSFYYTVIILYIGDTPKGELMTEQILLVKLVLLLILYGFHFDDF